METKKSKTIYLPLLIIGGTFLPAGIAIGLLGIPGVGIGMSGIGLVFLLVGLGIRYRSRPSGDAK
jgi:hypothetical protein